MSEKPRPRTITDPVTITVNGEEVVAQKGEWLIDACEHNGTYIPRFCYHPRMDPVGMCRMCLVEVDTGRGPALQPSCMINVSPDMVVETKTDLVRKVQDGILEYLLINHPLDCPVCDKGGECPLQDQTMSYGPGESRWVEEKRHYEKPIAISETVYLDRERCILCDRCTRFAKDVAGDPLIHFIDRGANTQVNTFPNEPFSSYFSGNTVQICPVGALTAKPYRFKARPWDLSVVESTCSGCAVGCRITVESSRDEVIRLQGVDSDPVNWSWLCDKGRFGFETLNSEDRLAEPALKDSAGVLVPTRWGQALEAAATAIKAAQPSAIGVIGGSRLTNESAYAWAKLAKGIIGTDNVDAQLGDGLPAELVFSLPQATIDEVCAPGGTILYLGPDPKEELGVLYLRLRHAVTHDKAKIVELNPIATGLTPYAASSIQYRPGDLAAVVEAITTNTVPANGIGGVSAEQLQQAADLVAAAGEDLRIVVGRANLAESAQTVVNAAQLIQAAKPAATFLVALRRGNVRGALEAGLTPGFLPGRVTLDAASNPWSAVWPSVPETVGLDTAGILEAAADGRIDVLILLGADPLVDFPDRSLARRALSAARTVIALDRFATESVLEADVVFPIAGFAESAGTHTNFEGRVTTLAQKVTPVGNSRTDWNVAAELALRLGHQISEIVSEENLWNELVAHSLVHAGLTMSALEADENADGIVINNIAVEYPEQDRVNVPTPNAYSMRLVVNRTLYDEGSGISRAPSSANLKPAAALYLSPDDARTLGIDSNSAVTVTSPNGSLNVGARVDNRIPVGVGMLRHALADADAGLLMNVNDAVCDIRVEVN